MKEHALWNLLTPHAVQAGVTCLVAQISLYLLFATGCLGRGPWSKTPSFTAHQVVTLPVLVYLSVQGLLAMAAQDTVATASDRLTGPRHGHFSECVLGIMLFWDIPTGLSTRALRDAPMVLHHFAMCATAALSLGALSHGTPVLGYYAPFFFGVVELSSLPLVVVDIFHPKHKEWNAYLTSSDRPGWLLRVNDVSRVVFALSFLVVRTVCFPYVSIFGVLSDVWQVAPLPLGARNGVPNLPLFLIAALNTFFSCLQLYWGSLLFRQIMKAVRGPAKAKVN